MPLSAVHNFGFSGTAREADEGPTYQLSEKGFDQVSVPYWCNGSEPVGLIETNFPRGTLLSGFANMYVTDCSAMRDGYQMWKLTVTAKGILSTQAQKRVVSSRMESFSTPTGDTQGAGTNVEIEGDYAVLTCSFWEILEESVNAFTIQVGKQGPELPMNMPTPPVQPSNWATAQTLIYRDATGWILESVDCEDLPGSGLFAIQRNFAYYHTYRPG